VAYEAYKELVPVLRKLINKFKRINSNEDANLYAPWFVGEKIGHIRHTFKILINQIELLILHSKNFEEFYINGIASASRALSELIIFILLYDKGFTKTVLSSLSDNENSKFIKRIFSNNNKVFKEEYKNNKDKWEEILNNKDMREEILINGLHDHILSDKLEHTSNFLPKIAELFNAKKISIKDIHDSLYKMWKIPNINESIIKKIFDKSKYKDESQAIHMPHSFYIDEYSIGENILNNLKIIYKLVSSVFLKHD